MLGWTKWMPPQGISNSKGGKYGISPIDRSILHTATSTNALVLAAPRASDQLAAATNPVAALVRNAHT